MIKTYGIWGTFILLRSWLFTRLFYPSAKLLLLPFDIRGEKYIQWEPFLGLGSDAAWKPTLQIREIALIIGDNVQLQDYVHITASSKVLIGNDVLIASKVYISDTGHGSYSGDLNDSDPAMPPGLRPISSKFVIIGDRVWLGESVSVLPGVVIGEGAIVGANSVVSKDIPANVIAVGVPAKPIKKFNFENKKWELI